MERSKEDMIRSFGTTAGRAMYVHVECSSSFLSNLASDGEAVKPDSLVHWEYNELMGRYSDITSCDECGKPFQATDKGYVSYWVSSIEDLAFLQKIQEEG
jgi:hypothetical protein